MKRALRSRWTNLLQQARPPPIPPLLGFEERNTLFEAAGPEALPLDRGVTPPGIAASSATFNPFPPGRFDDTLSHGFVPARLRLTVAAQCQVVRADLNLTPSPCCRRGGKAPARCSAPLPSDCRHRFSYSSVSDRLPLLVCRCLEMTACTTSGASPPGQTAASAATFSPFPPGGFDE